MTETAFVIMCNDSIEAVFIGTREQANTEMDRRREEYFTRQPWQFRNDRTVYAAMTSWFAREMEITRAAPSE